MSLILRAQFFSFFLPLVLFALWALPGHSASGGLPDLANRGETVRLKAFSFFATEQQITKWERNADSSRRDGSCFLGKAWSLPAFGELRTGVAVLWNWGAQDVSPNTDLRGRTFNEIHLNPRSVQKFSTEVGSPFRELLSFFESPYSKVSLEVEESEGRPAFKLRQSRRGNALITSIVKLGGVGVEGGRFQLSIDLSTHIDTSSTQSSREVPREVVDTLKSHLIPPSRHCEASLEKLKTSWNLGSR